MDKKKAEAKKAEAKAVKTVVDFDTTAEAIQLLLDTQQAEKLSHKDAFRLVTPEAKTIAYFHIRKYSIDVYVPEKLEVPITKDRLPCSSKGYYKVLMEDGKELFETLTIVYDAYTTAQKKKEAEAAKKKAEAKKKPAAKKS